MAFIDNTKDSHLDRLAYDEIRERRTPQSKYFAPAIFSYMGVLARGIMLVQAKRPVYSGLHYYALAVAIGIPLGFLVDDKLLAIQQKKYARLKHYIMLHPEDFPPYPPRITIGDTLTPWYPRRPGW